MKISPLALYLILLSIAVLLSLLVLEVVVAISYWTDRLSDKEVIQRASKTEKQVPKAMIGRRLSQEEAKRLLAKF